MKFNILKNDEFENYQLSYYEKEIFDSLRQNISSFLNQGKSLEFDNIIKITLINLGIEEYEKEEITPFLDWFENLTSFTNLKYFIEDDTVQEIIIHKHNLVQIISSRGINQYNDSFISKNDYDLSLEILAFSNKQSWNFKDPFCSFHLNLFKHSFRSTLIHYSTTPKNESKLFLRKINNNIFKLEDFQIKDDLKVFIINLIKNKNNVVISGSTCSGKTSLLASLLKYIDSDEHLVILEDTHEIKSKHPTTSYFLANENFKGKTLKDYCAYALRIRPDRIIMGEMRSSEIIPFILSMNTGHKGLISTIHANSALDSINRMGLLFSLYSIDSKVDYSTITGLICQNIEYIIHMENKKIKEIIKVIGSEKNIPYYEIIYSDDGGKTTFYTVDD